MARKSTSQISAVISIIAGVLIFIWPNILAIAIALWLIISGALHLIDRN